MLIMKHSVNFCHRDPETGTKAGNVYIGHCSCNREQGGHSEEERIEQVLRLVRANPAHQKKYARLFRELISSADATIAPPISLADVLGSY